MRDRYTTPRELPTPWENELLLILSEECNEVGQRNTKLQRFGKDEAQRGQPLTNAERLGREAGQLLFMIKMGLKYGLIDPLQIKIGEIEKPDQLYTYMQSSPPEGWGKFCEDEKVENVPTD